MIRIGAVGFLNARPLYEGLAADPRVALRSDVPSECARLLHAGEIDLGLVPAIELLRGPVAYDIVPGLAIGCDGPVNSVALFTRGPVSQVRRVALDTSSRSSVGLLRMLAQYLTLTIDEGLAPARPDVLSAIDALRAPAAAGR